MKSSRFSPFKVHPWLIVLICTFELSFVSCTDLQRLNRLGGAPEPTFVPAVPDSVSFVVLPFNDYLAQVRYAATVESILLEAGLTVIAPPRGRRTIEERKSAGIERGTGESSVSDTSVQRAEQQSLTIERYTVGEETRADYVVETMLGPSSSRGSVKFTRKSDGKVVGVFETYDNQDSMRNELFTALEKMKFIRRTQPK